MAAGRTKVAIQLSEQGKQHVRLEVNKRALAEGYVLDEGRIAAEIAADEMKMATITGRLAHTMMSDPRSKRDADYYQAVKQYLDEGWVDVHAMVGKKAVPFGHFVMMFARQGLDADFLGSVIRALDPSVKANVAPETNGEAHTILWLALKAGSAAKLGLLLNPNNPYPLDPKKSPWAEEIYEAMQRDFKHKPMDKDWFPVLTEQKIRHLTQAGMVVEPQMRDNTSLSQLFMSYFTEADKTWENLERGMQAQAAGQPLQEGMLTTQTLTPLHLSQLYSINRLPEVMRRDWWKGREQEALKSLDGFPLHVQESAAISLQAIRPFAKERPAPDTAVDATSAAAADRAKGSQRQQG